jgi:hypothetical protein
LACHSSTASLGAQMQARRQAPQMDRELLLVRDFGLALPRVPESQGRRRASVVSNHEAR